MLRRDLFPSCYVQNAVGMMETCILSAGYEPLSTGDPLQPLGWEWGKKNEC